MNTHAMADKIASLVAAAGGPEPDVQYASSGSVYLDWGDGVTCRVSDHAADASPYHARQLSRSGRAATVEVDPEHETSPAAAAGMICEALGLQVPATAKAVLTRRANAARKAREKAAAAEAARRAEQDAWEADQRSRWERARTNPFAWVAVFAAMEHFRRAASKAKKDARKRARTRARYVLAHFGAAWRDS